jgi:RNA polymerase sigma-70 factor (ECF subfamily)
MLAGHDGRGPFRFDRASGADGSTGACRLAAGAGGGGSMRTRQQLRAVAGDREQLREVLDPLALEAGSGSREALETVLWAIDELGLVRGVIRRLVIDEADVDDVGQDVLVAVAETIDSYRGEAPFTAWLSQVARFKAIAHLRRKRDEGSLDEVEPSDAVRISSALASRATLRHVLAVLPEHYQQAVVLRDVEQLPYDEVARRLGINLNTAKSRVSRGRALAAARLVGR